MWVPLFLRNILILSSWLILLKIIWRRRPLIIFLIESVEIAQIILLLVVIPWGFDLIFGFGTALIHWFILVALESFLKKMMNIESTLVRILQYLLFLLLISFVDWLQLLGPNEIIVGRSNQYFLISHLPEIHAATSTIALFGACLLGLGLILEISLVFRFGPHIQRCVSLPAIIKLLSCVGLSQWVDGLHWVVHDINHQLAYIVIHLPLGRALLLNIATVFVAWLVWLLLPGASRDLVALVVIAMMVSFLALLSNLIRQLLFQLMIIQAVLERAVIDEVVTFEAILLKYASAGWLDLHVSHLLLFITFLVLNLFIFDIVVVVFEQVCFGLRCLQFRLLLLLLAMFLFLCFFNAVIVGVNKFAGRWMFTK